MNKVMINLFELLKCISNATDLISPHLDHHHQQVAYLSYHIARERNLPLDEQKDIFLAALVHDIGVISRKELLEIIEEEPITVHNHAMVGAQVLADFKPLENSAHMIRYHHVPWQYGKGTTFKYDKVPYGSHIIHLADRICIKLKPGVNVLSQLPMILSYIQENRENEFESELVDSVIHLSKLDYIWLDLTSNSPVDKINMTVFDIVELEIDDVIDLSFIFSRIIDFRSSFTAKHSACVAKIAAYLAELMCFSPLECKMMLIAGYLHDLGKLAVDNEVLEKPGRLNEDEFNEIRAHSYYTYQLLSGIPQFRLIKEWAAFHHERVDGKGYPFHVAGENLSLGSRIMAVADIFCAITEDRPYRQGMSGQQVINVFNGMVDSGALDAKIVENLKEHFTEICELRENTENEAVVYYENYMKS
jgi:HD-GYP domain-containing protein (c-di-GMP phosphodiesterase class II)